MAENDSPPKKDFFISYNKADREWAEWIAQQLEQVGKYSVVIQAWDFRPGGNFVLDMQRALVSCNRMVAVLSPDYLTSVFTAPEWAAAFGDDSTGLRHKLVPVRIRECKPDGLLANIVYIDLLSLNAADAGNALLTGVDSKPVDRTTPRPFPGIAGSVAERMERPPGMLPEIWNVPHLRNPNFTEPSQRLTEMRDALRSGKPATLTQALAGLGGVGKTQLAIEFAYRHASDYALVWWVRSDQAAILAMDYAALATALDLPEKDAAEQPVIIAAVRNALQRRRDWLLVFDNANSPQEIHDYLPAIGGHVLITSRHASWGGVAQTVPVKKWTPHIAAEFLMKRTGKTDANAAKELAHELDYLPLALEQAAAYIDSAQKTFQAYLVMFREHQLVLLNRVKPTNDYPAMVGTTWDISLQRLEKESPGGVALLQLCAFLAPDDIPRDIFVAGAEYLSELLRKTVSDDLAFDDAVSAIRRYSLIEAVGESTLSLHRLVQAVVRDRLDGPSRGRLAGTAVNVMNQAFPNDSNEVRTWKECDRLLPHAIVAVDLAERLSVELEATAVLLHRMGAYEESRAKYGSAKSTNERALMLAERIFGPDHSNVAICANNLGSTLKALGDLPGAKAMVERALRIDEKILGSEHPNMSGRFNSLGSVLRALGDLRGAKSAFERALKLSEKALGPDHWVVGMQLNNLGLVQVALGDLPAAKVALERSLRIHEKIFGAHDQRMGVCFNNLGSVLKDLGDLTEAKAAFQRALKLAEESFGFDHPYVGICVNNLGGVLQEMGDLPGAKAAFERALKIAEEVFGPDHSEAGIAINNLGGVLKDLGNHVGAKAAYERALKIAENVFSPDHPDLAVYLNNVAMELLALGDLSAAKAVAERALRICQNSLGEDHPRTRTVRKNLDLCS